MSLLNEVQKFIEAHPGCTSGDIADAFAGYSRQRVLQSASKLRQSGRVAHRCEGDTRRHFPRLTERAQEPEPQPVRETRPVRNFYVGTNDPLVILCLTRQAEELESRGLYRRAATVWMAAFRESHSQPERNNFLARRERYSRTAINNIKKFWSLTAKGCMFGKNITSPANPRETQPHFFESRFTELLKLLDTVH
ncbi:PerC family transcriptional regulator [Escherichia coli]|nr:PerC family transcriptional regulator [Escherichia coli]MBS4271708.1 PerC family transcriptional regulator [Escherichia coli]MBS4291101.1 PerC family transcriptional regulator [Escherichia coli]HAH6410775.1 PerC family transcriptional regulator [Escherichia coli]